MNKEEILNDDFVEKEIIQPKSHKKLEITIAISTSLVIIATTILLVGYFKFDWFKGETYNIDAKISRNVYQANYFTETKTIKTKVSFTSGEPQNIEQILYTNFMVLQTDRKELENHDFLNTATIIILDSKLNHNNELKELISFNIYDQNKVNDFLANPNGSKYPMGIFSFYDSGKVTDIQLPDNMDQHNAHSIIELIENIVPKLTRNRVEDISNGININDSKDKKKRTLVETISPRELPNFKGSRFVKSVERDIEEDEITNIRSKASLDLITQLEEGESGFGLKDYKYETKSNIVSTGKKEEKQEAELVQKLAQHFTFIKSKELLEKLAEKEYVVDRWEEEEINEPDSKLRKLINFNNFNFDKTFTIKTITILGCSFKIKVRLGVKGGNAFGELIISANNGDVSFGTNGINASISKSWKGELTVFSFQFPPMPVVGINLRAGGSGKVSASLSTATQKITVSVSGSLYAKAQITAGWDAFISVSVGAKGTIVSATLSGTITTGGSISKSGTLSAGAVSVYVDGKLLNYTVYYNEWKVFDGWSTNF